MGSTARLRWQIVLPVLAYLAGLSELATAAATGREAGDLVPSLLGLPTCA